MKIASILRLLAWVVIPSLLILFIPVLPALAAAGTINIAPTTGPPQTLISLSGQNFTANSTFTARFGTTTVASGQVNSAGNINTSFQVPTLARGQYQVTVTTGALDTSNTALFTITPEITLGTSSGPVGTQVAVNGRGFYANSDVTLLFDGRTMATVQALTYGSFFNAVITVPASTKGTHTITAFDTIGSTSGVSFSVLPSINVTNTNVGVGDQIAINGNGFAASSNITIYWDGGAVGGISATTSASGSFTSNFTIPPSSRGQHTIRARDASANSASTILTVAQKMTLSPTTGSTGDSITIAGTGFSANRQLTILYDGAPIATSPSSFFTDSSGSFTASFIVPAGRAGTYRVEASDGINTSSADLVAVVKATISPETSVTSPGHVGMELTIDGTGFKANSTVSIKYTPDLFLATTTTNARGNFSVTFTIPPSAAGQHTITVTDGQTIDSFTFFMELTPPPLPMLVSPQAGTRADQPVHFVWQSVTDPSGVTYVLQVAKDANFTVMVLQKEGLTTSEYSLTEQQKLESVSKDEPYYWRVKTIDGASNDSGWSSAKSFYVDFAFELTGWILYTVMGVEGLVFLIMGYLLGRRKA